MTAPDVGPSGGPDPGNGRPEGNGVGLEVRERSARRREFTALARVAEAEERDREATARDLVAAQRDLAADARDVAMLQIGRAHV